jgi:lysophospholipase L1-like esterase
MTSTGEGTWQTYSFLPNIVEGLRQMANQHGAAYWSIYDAMGGWNSMKTWVENGYAGKDYMHFTQKGADIMGDRLAEAFMKQYSYYRFRRK